MAVKLIKVSAAGVKSEYAGIATSAGAGSAAEFPILDGTGKLDITFMPAGIAADTVTAAAGEALAANDLVYFAAAGTVFKADATSPAKAAKGYVLASVLLAGTATVYFDESLPGSGLTPGTVMFLSATAGLNTATAPTTSGYIAQEIGIATSATNIHVNIQAPITRV